MTTLTDFIVQNWRNIAVPLAVFVFGLIASFRLRKLALDRLSKWAKEKKWPADTILYQPIKRPFSILCLVLSIYLGLATSLIPDDWESLAVNSLWTLFVFVLVLAAFDMLKELLLFLGRRLNLPGAMPIIRNVSSIVIIVISVLVVLSLWGVPTGPLLVLITVAALLTLLALRDAAPNFFAGFQLSTWQHIKVGDYIRLENGEEGRIARIGWNNTQLQTPEGDILTIPNSQLTRQRITKEAAYSGGKTMIDLPSGIQTFDFDCGAKALQLVMAYYGIEVREDKLIKELKCDRNGTAVENMITVAQKRGFQVVAEHGCSLEEIKQFVDASHPVIVLIQAWAERYMTLEDWKEDNDDGHYAVVIGYHGYIIVFEDPSSFRRTWMTEEEFLARWHDIDPRTREKLDHFVMVLLGKEPARKALEHMG